MSDCKNKHLVGAYMLTELSTVGTAALKMARIESHAKISVILARRDSGIEKRNSCLVRNKTRLVTYF